MELLMIVCMIVIFFFITHIMIDCTVSTLLHYWSALFFVDSLGKWRFIGQREIAGNKND